MDEQQKPLTTGDVLEFLADGYSTAEIAEEWGVVPHTVVNRINRLKATYHARTHAQIVVCAIKAGELDIGLHVQVHVNGVTIEDIEARRLGRIS